MFAIYVNNKTIKTSKGRTLMFAQHHLAVRYALANHIGGYEVRAAP